MTVEELKERMWSSEVTEWAALFSNEDEDEEKEKKNRG